jgi:hypothetical protein
MFNILVCCNSNVEKLKRLLDSLYRQRYNKFSVLAYVYKADKDSLKLLAEYEKKGVVISCVLAEEPIKQNSNLYKNELLKYVSADSFVHFVNATDDYSDRTFFQKLVEKITNTNALVVLIRPSDRKGVLTPKNWGFTPVTCEMCEQNVLFHSSLAQHIKWSDNYNENIVFAKGICSKVKNNQIAWYDYSGFIVEDPTNIIFVANKQTQQPIIIATPTTKVDSAQPKPNIKKNLLEPLPIGKAEYLSSEYVPFTILVRSHERPKFLTTALQSILDQKYPNLKVLISMDSYDDLACLNVIKLFQSKGLNIEIVRVKPLGWPACNLYINELAQKVEYGNWVHVLDDKNKYITLDVFHKVSKIIKENEPEAIIARFVEDRGKKQLVYPPDTLWEKPPKLANFGSPNMFVPYNKLQYMIWTERHPGDFDGLNGVYTHCRKDKIYWLKETIVSSVPKKGRAE